MKKNKLIHVFHLLNRERIINHKVLLFNQLSDDKTETASARVESSTVFCFSCPHCGRFEIRLLLYIILSFISDSKSIQN